MKPWFVFGGEHYYPSGGSGDFIAAFATEKEALEFEKEAKAKKTAWSSHPYQWTEVVNVLDMMKDDYGN